VLSIESSILQADCVSLLSIPCRVLLELTGECTVYTTANYSRFIFLMRGSHELVDYTLKIFGEVVLNINADICPCAGESPNRCPNAAEECLCVGSDIADNLR
jgi:hypothetical protein